MKEGIGGTFMIYVLLVFLAVYITFIAVAFNYARAFKVKNKVIDIIEQNEGIDSYYDTDTNSAMGQIETYLNSVSYIVSGIDEKHCPENEYEYIDYDKGYCLSAVDSDTNNGEYYKVKTFIKLEIPFLNLGFTIPVKGETRKIERIDT